MKKKILVMVMLLTGILLLTSSVSAQVPPPPVAQDFFITAAIPAASSVSFNVSRVNNGPPITFTPIATTALDFNMVLNATLGIYLPTDFYAIDVAPSGGAGTPSVLIEYLETNNPNAPLAANGLSAKGTATVVRVTGPTGSQVENEVVKATLGNINNQNINAADIVGGFMRLYVGIATGDVAADPPGAEVFTNSDNPGSYQGTLTMTATLP